ncbi:MAG: hypothetical protein GY720_13305 [bacterium]|nr:hypothetical protein [bacterium]
MINRFCMPTPPAKRGRVWPRRFGVVGVLSIVQIFGLTSAALADPAVPTSYESRFTSIEPAGDEIFLAVVGGDAFVEIRVQPGHRVEIPGYSGEPYIQIASDGLVSVNERSPTKYANDDRFATSELPDFADPAAAAQWTVVGSDGRYSWHDHRTHWMSYNRPPSVSGREVQQVFAWEIPLTVDGVDRIASGTLEWHPNDNSVVPVAVGAVGLAGLGLWKRGRVRLLAALAGVAAGAALLAGAAQWLATPTIARTFPTLLVPPLFAVVATIAAAALAKTQRLKATQVIILACVALAVYTVGSRDVLSMPILPSALADPLERFITAATGWIALGVGALAGLEMMAAIRQGPAERGAASVTDRS